MYSETDNPGKPPVGSEQISERAALEPLTAQSPLAVNISIPTRTAILFLAQLFAILLMSFANRSDRIALLGTFYNDPSAPAINTAVALPALLVIVAWARCQPVASAPKRWIWSRGRVLL